MFAKVVLASSAEGRDPVHTLHLHMPRSLRAELSGHRALSQWSRLSRHVPVEGMIRELYTAPFIPWHWDRSHPGMTPEERLTPADQLECILLWNDARDRAVEIAQQLDLMNAHRQVVEMVVAPYLWVDTLVTATRWTGFFGLLDHEEADPHLRDLGRMMAKAIGEAEVQRLDIDQWHLPFISADEAAMLEPDDLCKISAARCARVSYAPFDGGGGMRGRVCPVRGSDRHAHLPPGVRACPDGRQKS